MKEIISTAKFYQGKLLNADDVKLISELHDSFILNVMSTDFTSWADAHLLYLMDKHFFICQDIDLLVNEKKDLRQNQKEIFEYTYDNFSNPIYRLQVEFYLGLIRTDIAIQIFYKFIQNINPDFKLAIEKHNCIKGRMNLMGIILSRLESEAEALGLYDHGYMSYWEKLGSFLNNNTDYNSLANQLVGLHYIPKEAVYVTLAQIMYWNTFGGVGKYLDIFFGSQNHILNHTVGYIVDRDNTKYKNVVASVVKEIARDTDSIFSNIFEEMSYNDNLLICDAGSGPSSKMIRQAIIDSGIEYECHAYDVSALDDVSGLNRKTYYFDLNDTERFILSPPSKKEYDLTCCGYVLHQVVNPIQATKMLISWTKNGGYFVNQDIMTGCKLQFGVLPQNLVDREGYIDTYSIDQLIVKVNDNCSKVGLLHKNMKYPSNIVIDGQNEYVWTVNVYKVFEVDNNLLDLFLNKKITIDQLIKCDVSGA